MFKLLIIIESIICINFLIFLKYFVYNCNTCEISRSLSFLLQFFGQVWVTKITITIVIYNLHYFYVTAMFLNFHGNLIISIKTAIIR